LEELHLRSLEPGDNLLVRDTLRQELRDNLLQEPRGIHHLEPQGNLLLELRTLEHGNFPLVEKIRC